ncbi:hypothetical protein BLOT_011438 [Blomia tropicalis]|nr:hypothetical protein BLOT_011438 [Blomia tropicalis]
MCHFLQTKVYFDYPLIIGTTLWNIDLAADYWYDTLEHGLGRRSLVRHSGTWTWPPIIGTTLWNIDLVADYWDDTLEHKLGRRLLGRNSGTWTRPPIIDVLTRIISSRETVDPMYHFFAEAVMLNINPDVDVLNGLLSTKEYWVCHNDAGLVNSKSTSRVAKSYQSDGDEMGM